MLRLNLFYLFSFFSLFIFSITQPPVKKPTPRFIYQKVLKGREGRRGGGDIIGDLSPTFTMEPNGGTNLWTLRYGGDRKDESFINTIVQ